MTPTEQAAKLARELAEADWPVDVYGEPASQKCAAKFMPIITAALTPLYAKLAERDEELKRLREAARLALNTFNENWPGDARKMSAMCELKSALQPKEPNNVQLPDVS